MNGDIEYEDEFGDFGGFEEADPVEPCQPIHGFEAGPSPWAMFPGTQPDLIQPQPPGQQGNADFLSTPQEDILGARPINAPIPLHSGGAASSSYPPVNHEHEPSFDEVIAQHQSNMVMGSPRGLPDLGQPIDIGASPGGLFEVVGPDVSQVTACNQQPDITPDSLIKGPSLPPNIPVPLGGAATFDLDIDGDGLYARGFNHSDEQLCKESGICVDIDSPNMVNGEGNKTSQQNRTAAAANNTGKQQADKKKEHLRLEEELSDVLAQQTLLEEMLVTCQQELQAQKEKYKLIQERHAKDLESLRKAGHDTLAVVVEEYKELTKTVVLEQKEINERRLKTVLEEQTELYARIMSEQDKVLQAKLSEQQHKINEQLMETIVSEQAKEQELIKTVIAEEQERARKLIEKTLNEERGASHLALQAALAKERENTNAFIQEEKDKFQVELEKERQTSGDLIRTRVTKEIEKCQSSIHSAIEDEHTRCNQLLRELKSSAKEDFHQYILEQKQTDASSRHHLLSATDLFLDSARQQISLLLNTITHGEQ